MTKRTPPYSPEVRERAVRMVLDHQGEHGSQLGFKWSSQHLCVPPAALRQRPRRAFSSPGFCVAGH